MTVPRVGLFALALVLSCAPRAEATGSSPRGTERAPDRESAASARFVSKIQGVYFRYERVVVDGHASEDESTMEIVPYGRSAAYVRLRTAWGNGHSCSLYEILEAESDALVYERHDPDGTACRMRIVLQEGTFRIAVQDLNAGHGAQTCNGSCGARGTFDGEDRFSLRLRRPIRYLRRLLESDEYATAVAHHQGRLAAPDTAHLHDLRRAEAAKEPSAK